MAEIGGLSEIGGEVTFEWKIEAFSSLTVEIDTVYISPKFYFSNASWYLAIHPNGEKKRETEGWIDLHLMKNSSDSPVTLNFTLDLKTVHGMNYPNQSLTCIFHEKGSGYGRRNLISRSDLLNSKSELLPSDVLTITCTMKNREPKDVTGSLFSRLQAVSDNLSEIYLKAKKADFLLKTDGRNITAHRMILETRSPVFAAMLRHNTKENRTGEVSVEDVDFSTMNSLLLYIYSGDIDTLTCENALSLYAAAEKYDIKAVKEMCSEFIIRNLSVEWVLDVIKFAELYQDEVLGRHSKGYFQENADKILETANWDNFVKENHGISVELLATVVKNMFKNGLS